MLWNTTLACTCIGTSTLRNDLKSSNFVFTGKVVASEIVSLLPEVWLNDSLWEFQKIFYTKMKYTFEVSAVYKGNITTDTLIVYSGFGGGDCGYEFLLGYDYIVYANWNESLKEPDYITPLKFIETNICTRTKLLNNNEIRKIKLHCATGACRTIYDEKINFVKSFYKEYILEKCKDDVLDLENIIKIKEKYCHKKLLAKMQKLQEKENLEYDPFLNSQDCDILWLRSLQTGANKRNSSWIGVRYSNMVDLNIKKDIIIKLKIISTDKSYYISDIKGL